MAFMAILYMWVLCFPDGRVSSLFYTRLDPRLSNFSFTTNPPHVDPSTSRRAKEQRGKNHRSSEINIKATQKYFAVIVSFSNTIIPRDAWKAWIDRVEMSQPRRAPRATVVILTVDFILIVDSILIVASYFTAV